MLVATQLSVPGLYLPPVFTSLLPLNPAQTIISLPVQTAVWRARASGALVVLVFVHLLLPELYLPASIKNAVGIKSAPDDHLAACPNCRVSVSAIGGAAGTDGRPTVRAWIVSAASVEIADEISTAPNDHLIPLHMAV